MSILGEVIRNEFWSLIGPILLIAAIAVLGLVLVVRRAALPSVQRNRRRGNATGATEPSGGPRLLEAPEPMGPQPGRDGFSTLPGNEPTLPTERAFQQMRRLIQEHASGPDALYAMPWVLMLGPTGAGKSRLLHDLPLPLPLGGPADDWPTARAALNWWLFDRGVVLDVAGALLTPPPGGDTSRSDWVRLMSLIRRHRGRRPLDGIVLVLPLGQLLSEMTDPGDRQVDTPSLAANIHGRLRDLQATLGLVPPVYVILTEAERLAGFASFASALPIKARGSMFGWSSPHGPFQPYQHDWVEEALNRIESDLADRLTDFAGTVEPPAKLAQMTLLPGAIAALRQPLQAVLDPMLKPAAYQEPVSLRGIYLAGAADPDGDSGKADVLFTRDVFEEKIFAEGGLARPTRQAMKRKADLARWLKIACLAVVLVGGSALAWESTIIVERLARLEPLAEVARAGIARLRSLEEAPPARREEDVEGVRRQAADAYLSALSRLDPRPMLAFTMPASWGDALDRDLSRLNGEAFAALILPQMPETLLSRGRRVLTPALPGEEAAELPVAAGDIATLAAFRRLADYLEGADRLSQRLRDYQAVRRGEALNRLPDLVHYGFGYVIPANIPRDQAAFALALESRPPPPLDAGSLDERAVAGFRQLMASLAQSMIATDPLWLAVADVSTGLATGIADRAALAGMAESGSTLLEVTTDPSRSHLVGPPTAGPTLGALLEKAAANHMIGPAEVSRETEDLRDALRAARRALLQRSAPGFDAVVTTAPATGQIVLSDPMRRLAETLSDLMRQPFMQALPAIRLSRERLATSVWDASDLQSLLTVLDGYRQFFTVRGPSIPADLRGPVERIARQQLASVTTARLSAALRPAPRDPAEHLAAAAENGQATTPLLEAIVQRLAALGLDETEAALVTALRVQGEALLTLSGGRTRP